MIVLRNNSHGGIIRDCMGICTTALRNEQIRQFLNKNTSPYFHSVSPVIWPLTLMKKTHFGELSISGFSTYIRKALTYIKRKGDQTSDNPCNYFSNRYLCGWYSTFQWIGKLRPKSFTRRSFTITWFSVTIRFENLIDRKKSNHWNAIRLLALNETSWDPLYNHRRDPWLSGKSIYAAMKCSVLRLQMTHFDTFLNYVLSCAI